MVQLAGPILDPSPSPDTAVDDDPSWCCIGFQGRGISGEASGERARPHGRYSLGNLLRLVPLHAVHVVVFGSRAGHSVCPAVLVLMTMTNVRTPRVGGSGWGVAEWLESGLIARAATEESFGSSPGSSSGVSCLWSLSGP
jgi:hypothetical protein